MQLNSTQGIASNKQRQEHNNLAAIWRANHKGGLKCSKSLQLVKTENPNANPNKNEQSSRWGLSPYDNNPWKRELDETNTFVVNLNLKAPFFCIYINFKKIYHTRKKKKPSHLCILYTLMLQIMPLLTLT